MSKDWVYAKMAHEAAEAGGPDTWIELIKNNSYNEGASDMKSRLLLPLLATGVTLGVAVTVGYQKINNWINEKQNEGSLTKEEAVAAEEFLKKELSKAVEDAENEEGVESK